MPSEADLSERLRDAFSWRGANNASRAGCSYADDSGWWADPDLLREIGPALAGLHGNAEPTLVAGIEAKGFLIRPLVAAALGIRFLEIRKGGKTGKEYLSDSLDR